MKTYVLGVTPKVTPEQINRAVAHVLTVGGCPACGLLGFDLRIQRETLVALPPDPIPVRGPINVYQFGE